MQKTVYFTSIVPNYLAKARVLCESLKETNPGSFFVLGICDSKSIDEELLKTPFDAYLPFEAIDSIIDKRSFLFKHNVTELCTAVKPFYAEEIMKRFGAEKVIYLDPDIVVFYSLEPLSNLLEKSSIILTPHQLKPENEDIYVRENEILFLKRGTYNLGFFGVNSSQDGLEILHWWQSRLLNYCFDDNYEVLPDLSANGLLGLFTDQKWVDLIPSFFPSHQILRDPGYNVCTWNLSHRHVEMTKDGKYLVNGYPMRFFHFSGFDSGGHYNELLKSLRYYPHNSTVLELDKVYERRLKDADQEIFGSLDYSLTKYDNGETIQSFERKIYHIRKDTHHIFGDPYKVTTEEPCFYNWVRTEYAQYFDEENGAYRYSDENAAYKAINKYFPRGTLRRKILLFIFNRLFPRTI